MLITRETIQQLIAILQQYEQSINSVYQLKTEDPLKGCSPGTKEFIRTLYFKFGNEKIYRRDKYVTELAYDCRVTDVAQVLKRLSNDGYCEIVYDKNKINYFKFTKQIL